MITVEPTDTAYTFKMFAEFSNNPDLSKPWLGKPDSGYFCKVCSNWNYHTKECPQCSKPTMPETNYADNLILFKTKNGVRLINPNDTKSIQWALTQNVNDLS